MTKETLQKAISEAKRFLELAKKVKLDNDSWNGITNGTKESAACKRASMDLTRALAEMRKP